MKAGTRPARLHGSRRRLRASSPWGRTAAALHHHLWLLHSEPARFTPDCGL